MKRRRRRQKSLWNRRRRNWPAKGWGTLQLRLRDQSIDRMERLIRSGRLPYHTKNAFLMEAAERLIAYCAHQLQDEQMIEEVAQAAIETSRAHEAREAAVIDSILGSCDPAILPMLEAGLLEVARDTVLDILDRVAAPRSPWRTRLEVAFEAHYPDLLKAGGLMR